MEGAHMLLAEAIVPRHLGISLGLLSATCDIWESPWGHLETMLSCLSAVMRWGRASLGNPEASPRRLGCDFYHSWPSQGHLGVSEVAVA